MLHETSENKADELPFLTKNEWVYVKLKENIANGTLLPGQRLIVSKIADDLKVSPMPVREAINRLCQDGFVVKTPHTGASVSSISHEQLYEIMNIRQELEAYAASLAVSNIDDNGVIHLENLISKMEECYTKSGSDDYESLNWEFHQFLYNNCGNKTLYDIVASLWHKSSVTRMIFVRLPDKLERSFTEHLELMKAIKKRDAGLVRELMYNHIKYTTDRVAYVIKANQR